MLVSLTFILCFGGSISAECSWILWSKVTLDPGKAKKAKVNSIPEFEWEIEQSHTTLVACQKSLENAVETGKYSMTSSHISSWVDGSKGSVTSCFLFPPQVITNNGQIRVEPLKDCPGWTRTKDFICIPDTIDPRTPKR
jgi:hypothetical protein